MFTNYCHKRAQHDSLGVCRDKNITVPVYVVSLSAAIDRRTLMAQQLQQIGVEYTFVSAISGSEQLHHGQARAQLAYGMAEAIVACQCHKERLASATKLVLATCMLRPLYTAASVTFVVCVRH